ncbi:MAG: flagellar FlbD family protein [Thermoguttaceae bacterium]|nr:flagellar FlbD family protein [Thermoguttaceae bacterium]MDW8077459.1 flagellar FlbD family protein [Thermoguttaceae bacterium]
MIRLTRLGGQEFLLNAELIRYVEECPDTIITLTTGDRVIVREKMDEVLRRVIAYHQAKLLFPAATGHGCRHGCCQQARAGRSAA